MQNTLLNLTNHYILSSDSHMLHRYSAWADLT